MNYYNEIDPKAAAWLRQLIADGHIPAGDVDERDIRDVRPSDLAGYTQCHFFAGIGGWPLALSLAGVPANRRLWTGSCPCQPFSAAGRRGGVDDERHLWPHWFHLIEICRPASVFGEQVASKDGLGWLDTVSADLEGAGYAVGASDLCAAGVGAPHIRQRLFFGAYDTRPAADRLQHASRDGRQEWWAEPSGRGIASRCVAGDVGDARGARSAAGIPEEMGRCEGNAKEPDNRGGGLPRPNAGRSESERLADGAEREQRGRQYGQQPEDGEFAGRIERPGPTNGFWRDADWLRCRDDKWRAVEPGTFPLVNGVSDRVGLLRGYGNAIVPQVAATFIQAFEEARTDLETPSP